jgi:hypothetical protein
MAPNKRIYLIDKATEIVREKNKKLIAKNIPKEFNKLVSLMDIPRIRTVEITYGSDGFEF